MEANERTNALYRIILNASTLLSSCNVLFIVVLLLLYCVYKGIVVGHLLFVTYNACFDSFLIEANCWWRSDRMGNNKKGKDKGERERIDDDE